MRFFEHNNINNNFMRPDQKTLMYAILLGLTAGAKGVSNFIISPKTADTELSVIFLMGIAATGLLPEKHHLKIISAMGFITGMLLSFYSTKWLWEYAGIDFAKPSFGGR